MVSLIILKSFLIFSPINKKSKYEFNVSCNCNNSEKSSNYVFPYAPFSYSTELNNAESSDIDNYSNNLDLLDSSEPEVISIDNLYLEYAGPEVILDPYAGPDKDYYGPYSF